jgi:mRNA interferase RelE/StbE
VPRIELYKAAVRLLERLPPRHRRQVSGKIIDLARDPAPPDAKPLEGFDQPLMRADIGEYRIVYLVIENVLHVPLVGKRNDDEVYRRLRRKLD